MGKGKGMEEYGRGKEPTYFGLEPALRSGSARGAHQQHQNYCFRIHCAESHSKTKAKKYCSIHLLQERVIYLFFINFGSFLIPLD